MTASAPGGRCLSGFGRSRTPSGSIPLPIGSAVLLRLLPVVLAAGCGADGARNAPNPDTRTGGASSTAAEQTGPVTASDLATDLDSPWGLVALDDGSVLIGSRNTGSIGVLRPGSDAVAEVGALEVRAEGESGLLGLVTTAAQDVVYAYYTTDDDSRVVRMTWDGRDLGEPEAVVTGIPGGQTFHQGGGLAIGPDDLLYVATGDNGDPERAQDEESLNGKILRYDLDGQPADNPSGTAVYSLGHRNVEGLAFDDAGQLWASEFGAQSWDELNRIEAGGNYGWPEVEGTGGEPEFVDPVAVWSTDAASPSGLAWWGGSLWMAALRGRTLWEIPISAGRAADPIARLRGEYGRLRNVVPTSDGGGLLLATSNTDGRGEPAADDDRLLLVERSG